MAVSSSAATRVGFWLNLPDGWLPLDIEGGRIPAQVAALIEQRAAADPNVAAHRRVIEQQIASALRAARRKELAFAAILATCTRDGLPIAASLAVTRHRMPGSADLDAMLGAAQAQAGRTVSLLDTPFAGAAVRCAWRERIAAQPGVRETAEVALVQYHVPIPGRQQQLLTLTGATPTLPMAEVFGTLFDAIVSTLQFLDAPLSEVNS